MNPDEKAQLDQNTSDLADLQKALGPYLQNQNSLIRMNNLPGDPPSGFEGAIAAVASRLKIFANSAWVDLMMDMRVEQITSASAHTVDTDSYDALDITALAATINSIDVSGTPHNFQKLIIRIKDNGGSQSIYWSSTFASRGAVLPSASVAGKIMTLGFLYNSNTSTFDCVAYVHE